ncbi:MAG TPA: hypothetical protein VNQ73_22815 [Ilumatobacter sp.]|nr:hypothetical protein [Ilumatobacter sp.]
MPLHELHDDDLDNRLRELLPPMPRSQTWERNQRELLVQYIATGTVVGSSEPTGPDSVPALALDVANRPHRRATWWWLGAAAATVALIGGLVLARPGDPARSTQPPVVADPTAVPPPVTATNTPTIVAAPTTTPALAPPPLAPDRFPIIVDQFPGAAAAIGEWGGQISVLANPAQASALVARSDGTTLRDAVVLLASAPWVLAATEPQHAQAAGLDVYTVQFPGRQLTTAALAGTPELLVVGLDPLAFIEAAGGFPIDGARIDADGEPTFLVGALPDGYSVITNPARLARGSVSARTSVPTADDTRAIEVWVQVGNPLVENAPLGPVHHVDIDGVTGWSQDAADGASVFWQVSDTTWASVRGAPEIETALALAAAVEFADEATWTARYDVGPPELEPDRPSFEPSSAFTPLLLDQPPSGFGFLSASYDPGPGGVGIAHYGRPGDATQLQIVVSARHDGARRMVELGREPVDVDGLTVYADGEGDGRCLHDVCSIGLQWDADTFASLRWVNVDGQEPAPGSTRESLIALLPHLVVDPDPWSPAGATER